MTEILNFEEHKIKHAKRNKLHVHYKSKPVIREDSHEMVISALAVTSFEDDPELVIVLNQYGRGMEGGRLDTLMFSIEEIPYLMDALQEAYDYVAEQEQ